MLTLVNLRVSVIISTNHINNSNNDKTRNDNGKKNDIVHAQLRENDW